MPIVRPDHGPARQRSGQQSVTRNAVYAWRIVWMSAIVLLASQLIGRVESAHADSCSEKQDEAAQNGANYKTVRGPNGRKVFVIEKAFVVCGTVPRPNVIYVLQATSINYEWENLKQDFIPLIRKSVRKWPF